METIYNRLSVLTDEYQEWCKVNNLPKDISADELLYIDHGFTLTTEQVEWITKFIERWNDADKLPS